MQEQHVQATGKQMNPSVSEMNRLKKGAVPSTVLSTLDAVSHLESYPNICYLLSVLAVMPLVRLSEPFHA